MQRFAASRLVPIVRPPTPIANPTRRNTSPPDGAPQSPMLTAPAPAGNPSSGARRYFLPDGVAQTAWSDLPGSDMLDSQTNTESPDIFGGTNRGCASSLRPRCPVPRGFSCADIRPGPRPSPR